MHPCLRAKKCAQRRLRLFILELDLFHRIFQLSNGLFLAQLCHAVGVVAGSVVLHSLAAVAHLDDAHRGRRALEKVTQRRKFL